MKLFRKIEAILFVCGSDGISFVDLQKILNIKSGELKIILKSYENKLKNSDSALQLMSFGNKYKLTTKEDLNETLSALVDNKPNRLSQSALETLSIIAYKSPITRIEIEDIRGVDSTTIIAKLMSLDLIKESGRAKSTGSPILYKVSDYFMDFFKLSDLSQLPDLPNLQKHDVNNINIYKSKYVEEKNG